jgi:hypothetical protein
MKTTKRGRPFLKVCLSPSPLALLTPLPFYLPGHPRPLCNSRSFFTTHNPQAVLPVLPKLFFYVRLVIFLYPLVQSFQFSLLFPNPLQR